MRRMFSNRLEGIRVLEFVFVFCFGVLSSTGFLVFVKGQLFCANLFTDRVSDDVKERENSPAGP